MRTLSTRAEALVQLDSWIEEGLNAVVVIHALNVDRARAIAQDLGLSEAFKRRGERPVPPLHVITQATQFREGAWDRALVVQDACTTQIQDGFELFLLLGLLESTVASTDVCRLTVGEGT